MKKGKKLVVITLDGVDSVSAQLRRLVCTNIDVVLVSVLAAVILFYNLDGWMMMTLEEWQFYRDFTTDWFASRRIHSFFLPTYILAWSVPSQDFFVLRHFTAGLSVIGVIMFHLAVRQAANSRLTAVIASLLVVTDAWLLWFGRQFTWFWSAITVSAIMIYVFVRWRERSLHTTSILGAVSILNFSQAVFFVVPFLSAQIYSLRDQISRKNIVVATLLFLLLVSPSMLIFLEKQEHHVALQEDVARSDGFIRIPFSVAAPGVGQQNIVWTIDPFNTFKQLTWRLGVQSGGLHNFDWPPLEQGMYLLLSILVLFFPFLAYWRVNWRYTSFFALGAVTAFVFLIFFPFLTDDHYLWGFSLFIYPLLAYSVVKSEDLPIQILALALTVSVITFQGVVAYQYIITPNYAETLNNTVGDTIAGEDIIVTERADAMIHHSRLPLLERATKYTVRPCDDITNSSAFILSSDACVRLGQQRELAHNPKGLNLYR